MIELQCVKYKHYRTAKHAKRQKQGMPRKPTKKLLEPNCLGKNYTRYVNLKLNQTTI